MFNRSITLLRFYHYARNHRAVVAAGAAVVGLWVLTLIAISETWHIAEPPVPAFHMSAPTAHVRFKPISWIPLTKHDGIPVVNKKKYTSAKAGIVKRAGVQLTKLQASFVSKLGQYLKSQGEFAIVTSGARSPEHQLSIIKSKIKAAGATRKFPSLKRASVKKTTTWLAAWNYLRARHVPVNAPTSANGAASASNHIKGLAVDLISGSLDHLRNLITGFASSNLAQHALLKVASIAREPGCVHVNLQP